MFGSGVTRRFTKDQLTSSNVLGNVFTRKWDDVSLSSNLAISQPALLLGYDTNNITEIKKIKETESSDSDFETHNRIFAADDEDIQSLSECVRILKERASIRKLPIPSSSAAYSPHTQLADCVYAYAAYTSHKKIRSPSLKGLAY